MRTIFFALLLSISTAAWTSETVISTKVKKQGVEPEVSSMSLDEKIGQLFLIGIPGTQFTKHTRRILNQIKPGGVIAFSRNIKSYATLAVFNQKMQEYALSSYGIPLFLAVDQEGDRVARVKTIPRMLSPASIGNTNNERFAFRFGEQVGRVLRTVGFNMNLAPVFDLSNPNIRSFIGNRSFGGDPANVAKLTSYFIAAQAAEGVISTAKHFPTHGHHIADSHHEKSRATIDKDAILNRDMEPYKFNIRKNNLDAVMVAHVSFPEIDPSGKPATFSKVIIQGYLRKKLGFDGLVITDDLEMSGAKSIVNFGARAIAALEAGADMIMYAWNLKAQRIAANDIKKAVLRKKLSIDAIDKKVSRIIRIKKKYALFHGKLGTSKDEIRRSIYNKGLARLNEDVLQYYKTLPDHLFDEELKVSRERPLLVMSTYKTFLTSFAKRMNPRAIKFAQLHRRRTLRSIVGLLEKFPKSNVIFHVTGSKSKNLLNGISRKYLARVVLVNSLTPGEINDRELFRKSINVYSNLPGLGQVVSELITPPRLMARDKQKIRRRPTSKNN